MSSNELDATHAAIQKHCLPLLEEDLDSATLVLDLVGFVYTLAEDRGMENMFFAAMHIAMQRYKETA